MEVNCKGINECNWNTTQQKFILTYFLTKLLRSIYKFQLGHFSVYISMKDKQYFSCRDDNPICYKSVYYSVVLIGHLLSAYCYLLRPPSCFIRLALTLTHKHHCHQFCFLNWLFFPFV